MRLPNNEAETVVTMDSTIATPTKLKDNEDNLTNESLDQGDMEQASLRPSHSESDPFRGSTEKGGKSKFVLMRKSTLFFLAFLLLLFVVAFGYFFSEWMYEREFNAASKNGDKANCILEDEVECPYTEEDMENLSAEIDRLEDLNSQLSNQLDDYEDLTIRLNASVEGGSFRIVVDFFDVNSI